MNTHIDELPPVSGAREWVAIDLEIFTTFGDLEHLHRPYTGRFACVQIATGEDVYVITKEEQVQAALDRIDAATWVIHNGKFDLTHLRRWANVPPRKKYYDTMYMEKILWSGYYIHFSLAACVRRYLGVYMEKETRDTFEGGNSLTHEQLEYAALDAYYTLQVAKEQRKLLKDSHIKVWTEIDRPALWAFLDFKGFAIDVDKWELLGNDHKRLQDEIDNRLPLNPRSPQQIKKFLSNSGIKVKSTEAEELTKLLETDINPDVASIVQDILDSKMYATRASRYGLAFIENFLEQDNGVNVIVGDYQLIGAECMPAGELVLTNRGYLPVELVCQGDLVLTHHRRARPVIETGIKGLHKVCRVTLENGLSLRTTYNHPYLSGDDGSWINASDMEAGMNVVVHVDSYEFGSRWATSPDMKITPIFSISPVVSVTEDGYEWVYGLTVEEDASHVTGGIVTHNTGRTACKNPNMQNIPARDTKVFRECFIARPGHKLIIADFSSQEPYISAVVSGEPRLLEWIRAGKDIYIEMAREVFGKIITKSDPERGHMKSIILGGNYGMSKYGLSKKLHCTPDEAQTLIDKTHKVLPVYAEYMRGQKNYGSSVCTPFGRTIHLNPYSQQSERNALNAPIQGGAGDQMKAALGHLHHTWNEYFYWDFPVVGYIHDELVSDVMEDVAEDAAQHIKTTLENVATRMVNGIIQFKVDVHIGDTWAEKG